MDKHLWHRSRTHMQTNHRESPLLRLAAPQVRHQPSTSVKRLKLSRHSTWTIFPVGLWYSNKMLWHPQGQNWENMQRVCIKLHRLSRSVGSIGRRQRWLPEYSAAQRELGRLSTCKNGISLQMKIYRLAHMKRQVRMPTFWARIGTYQSKALQVFITRNHQLFVARPRLYGQLKQVKFWTHRDLQ